MAAYDLEALSPFEFEELVGDLLQAEMGIRFELFKPGRDSGIDLRYCLKNKKIIVQCKHFFNSPYKVLKKSLDSEKEKVAALKPKRYIIATSCGLTPGNKKVIKSIFSPYCLNEGDIFGKNDILKLLKDHEDVVKKNFKLWFTSEAVLSKILHSKILNQTEIDLEGFKEIIPKLVLNKSYERVQEIMNRKNSCVICGQPGIGKSTLMRLFVIRYAAEGFEPIKISKDIRESYELLNKTEKQIFYYDDFLGQTFLKNGLGKNEDSEICNFIRQINKMPDKKLILATREHILNQAIEQYEKLSSIRKFESMISISDFSSIIKAQILFNHLWHSKIEEKNIQEILKNKNYLKIIRHPHFNPRIIEWMTKDENVNKEDYFKIFSNSLQHPDRLWKHAFENELLESSKILLIVLISFESYFGIEKDNLFDAFKSACHSFEGENFNEFQCLSDFEKSLHELDGTFIKTEIFGTSRIFIKFSNPSIKDYLQTVLTKNKLFISHICESSVDFEQLLNVWTIVEKTKYPNDYSKYFDYEIYLRSIDRFLDDPNNDFDKILLHLVKVSQTIQLKSYVNLANTNLVKFKSRIRNDLVDPDIVFGVYSQLQRNPTIFSIDFDELKNLIKTYFLSKEHYHIKDLTELIDNFNKVDIELDYSERMDLKTQYDSVIDQGIVTDSIEESNFGIYEYNPIMDSFDQLGSGIYELETLTRNIDQISSYLNHDSEDVISDLEAKIVLYYSNLPKNKKSGGLVNLDVSKNSEDIDIDKMFESLIEK